MIWVCVRLHKDTKNANKIVIAFNNYDLDSDSKRGYLRITNKERSNLH